MTDAGYETENASQADGLSPPAAPEDSKRLAGSAPDRLHRPPGTVNGQ